MIAALCGCGPVVPWSDTLQCRLFSCLFVPFCGHSTLKKPWRKLLLCAAGFATVLLLLLALVFVRTALAQSILDGVVIVGVLVMIAEGTLIGRKVRALAAERLPGVSTRGVTLYAAMRALQIRKLRMPKPRVNVGDKV